jgi:parallel beta-helix repeat protein
LLSVHEMTASSRILAGFVSACAMNVVFSGAVAAPCGPEVRALALSARKVPFRITCDLSLKPSERIVGPLLFEGEASSGTRLDCHGATIDAGGDGRPRDAVIIRSAHDVRSGAWDVPRHVTIDHCVIDGNVRIYGLGPNGQSPLVKESSLQPGHTGRAQAAAPSDISLIDVRISTLGWTAIYIGPGVTRVRLVRAAFSGRVDGPAVYLDAESASNDIVNSSFDLHEAKRELIAVDGSARNRIEGNHFSNPIHGGIFLYRNCGEGGAVRHQAPTGNVIFGNSFGYGAGVVPTKAPAIWLGSRNGRSPYCGADAGSLFGSGADDRDFADGNTVDGNRFIGYTVNSPTLDAGDDNHVANNVSIGR